MKNKFKFLLISLFLILLSIGLIVYFLYIKDIELSHIIDIKNSILLILKNNYPETTLSFMFLHILLTTLFFPVGFIFGLLSGAIFGFKFGLLINYLCMMISAWISYNFGRIFIPFFNKKKFTKKLFLKFNRYNSLYLFSSRIIPGMPFALTNIIAGFIQMKFSRFFIITLISFWRESAKNVS